MGNQTLIIDKNEIVVTMHHSKFTNCKILCCWFM